MIHQVIYFAYTGFIIDDGNNITKLIDLYKRCHIIKMTNVTSHENSKAKTIPMLGIIKNTITDILDQPQKAINAYIIIWFLDGIIMF